MSLIQMRFLSDALNMFTPVNIILPMPRDSRRPMQDVPVLYLFHGMGDDFTSWLRKTCIERRALARGLAVVMPDGELSCYENMVHGAAFRDYFTKELPELIARNFPVSTAREKNFIAGCSMGGFGALKLALACPEKWSAVGCFSAAHFEYRNPTPRHSAMLNRVYGEQLDAYDARIAADALDVNAGKLPLRIWHSCGDDDALRTNALKTRAFFEGMKPGAIDYSFRSLPGRHDWAQWDEAARLFIGDLNLPETEVQLF